MSWHNKFAPLVAAVGVIATMVAVGAGAGSGPRLQPQVFYPVKADVSPPIRSMAIPAPQPPARPWERVQPGEIARPATAPVTDPVVQRFMGPGNMPAPLVSMDGVANSDNGNILGIILTPADTEGAVGGLSPASNVYIQWVNLMWSVYDKTSGAKLAGPYPGNIFWSGFGGQCQTANSGDIIVLYDKLADRWFFSQFAVDSSPYMQCVAVSTSPDPLGSYYRYAINTGSIFPDYPKFSVWADAYYGTANGNGAAFFMALERNKILVGDPSAALITFNLGAPYGNDLPVDFDGTAPAPGTPGIFTEVDKAAWIPGLNSDSLLIWYLTPNWANPGSSCLGASCSGAPNEIVPVATFTAPLCGGARNCIPQPPGGEGLDSISDRVMYRAQGRDLTDHQSLLISHTVDAGGGIAGPRWYELRSSGGWNTWSMFQQGTYSPDSNHRWMGSVAMDHSGDIALGYSVSSTSVFTSVRYAGRLPGDPLNTLPQAEAQIVAGDGVTNTGYNRWGDYSAMQVDPTDDCTFWYTQMYDAAFDDTGSYPGWMWNTRIGSFKFPNCSIGPQGTITGTVTNAVTSNPISGALVQASASSTLTNGSGVYTMTLPVAGSPYNMTASKFGYAPASVTGVVVTENTTTTQNFALTPVGQFSVDGYVTDGGHGWPLYAKIVITATGTPTTTIYTDPFNGYYDVVLVNGYDYTFTVTAMTPGYNGAVALVSVSGADQTQNFILWPVSPACTVPGYGPSTTGFGETFDEVTAPALPANWETVIVSDPYGENPVWQTANGTVFYGTPAHSAPNSVGINNYAYLSGEQARLDSTTVFNMTTVTPPQLSFWAYHNTNYCGYANTANVQPQVSTDGGSTWINVGDPVYVCDGTNQWTQYTVDLSAYQTQTNLRIGFLDTSDYWNPANLDDVLVGAPGACTPKNGGLVAGFVKDGNTNTGLVGAKVANDLGGFTFTINDPNVGAGYYSFFTPTPPFNGPALRTFTASMANYGSESVQEAITQNTVNRLDFTLQAGWLQVSPLQLISRLYPGQDEHQNLTLTNNGGLTANFKLLTIPKSTTWPHFSPVKQQSNGPKTYASVGRAPGVPHASGVKPGSLPYLTGVPGFAEDINTTYNYGTWPDVTNPSAFTPIASEGSSDFWVGGCFLNSDFSQEYFITFYGYTLNTVNTSTGAVTTIGPVTANSGENVTGLTTTPSGVMYAAGSTCASSTLYTVNPSTGATTVIGPITNAPCMIAISSDVNGNIYGVDIVNDNLVRVDPATGAGTIIGSTGINANFAQGLSFDLTNNVLYWASFNYDTYQGEMRVIDTTTGASTLIGVLPNGAEFDAFATQTAGSANVPWLILTPTTGSVAPAANFHIDAHFIADGADHFGLFRATIKTNSDTPYAANDVSVCFTKAFLDVPVGYWADAFVHRLAGARITTGCGSGDFCPDDAMTRGVMARWLLLGRFGNLYSPPPCVGIFADVVCESTPNADYIEALYNAGITAGCATNPLRFCPNDPVTRAQMAVFIIVSSQPSGYVPPPCTGIFNDVPCPGGFAVNWIEDLYNRGITAGCGNNNFCPDSITSRAQEAVFLDTVWAIPMCSPPPVVRVTK